MMLGHLLVDCCVTACRFDARLYAFCDWKLLGQRSVKSHERKATHAVLELTGNNMIVHRVDEDRRLQALVFNGSVRG